MRPKQSCGKLTESLTDEMLRRPSTEKNLGTLSELTAVTQTYPDTFLLIPT
jgi:hypothetical protein